MRQVKPLAAAAKLMVQEGMWSMSTARTSSVHRVDWRRSV